MQSGNFCNRKNRHGLLKDRLEKRETENLREVATCIFGGYYGTQVIREHPQKVEVEGVKVIGAQNGCWNIYDHDGGREDKNRWALIRWVLEQYRIMKDCISPSVKQVE